MNENVLINRTYVTKMPDNSGAFLKACEIIKNNDGNIVRVSYNKTVDTHILFIEVSAEENQHFVIQEQLIEIGYLSDKIDTTRLILIELKLPDVSGSIIPVLQVINRYNVNISYMNSHGDGTEHQFFKMGLLIDDQNEFEKLRQDISKICEVRVLDYSVSTKHLDGSVFYYTYANEMKELLNLNQTETASFVVNSNKIMQFLEEKDESPMKTFQYIYRFAKFVVDHKGEQLHPHITKTAVTPNTNLYLIEVACGSNTAIFENGNSLLFVDCGFACYKEEMLAIFKDLFPDFETRSKSIMLTHGDIDHTGFIDFFDKAYMVQSCYDNFILEQQDMPNFREQNRFHAPYCRLSKFITGYKAPSLKNAVIIGKKEDDEPLSKVGNITFGDLQFEVFEGNGGHVRGETVFVCHEQKLLFSGDILVNIKGFSDEQREFNILAPYLMTSVNVDSKKAKISRELIMEKYKGYKLYPAHGGPMEN